MQDDKKRLQIQDESLSPDEEHKIEVKVDKMLSLNPAAAIGESAAEKAAKEKPKPKPKKSIEVTEAPMPKSAPALAEPPLEPEPTPEPEPEAEAAPEAEPQPESEDEIAEVAEEEAASETGVTPQADPEPADTLAAKEREAELAAQDAEIAAAFRESKPTGSKMDRIKHFFAAWWHNPKARLATLAVLVLLLLVALVLPASRAWALNAAGIRARVSVTIVDKTTQLPLKNVRVSIGSASGMTDAKGSANLAKVKLGKQPLTAQKVAFAPLKKAVTISMGTNKLGTLDLIVAGTQYHLHVVGYATGKAIASSQANSGEASAVADSKGDIVLAAINPESDTLDVHVTASGYRSETVKVPVGSKNVVTVQLVLSHHEVYVSKQSGTYDVYRSDIDGKNKKVILAGTGKETDNLQLVPHPTAEEAALVDTRDGSRDSGGFLLQTLTLINVATGAPTAVDHSEKIQIIDWQGDRLVYVMVKAGASAANPSRYQLMSYDYRTNQRLELDHANNFNDIVSAGGAIYYATSNQYNGGVSQLVKQGAAANGRQVLLTSEVWNIFRKDYDNFYLAGGDASYTYQIGDAKPAATKSTFDGSQNRLYINSPDDKHSLWVDTRDGKGALILYDTKSQKETVVAEVDGLTYPVRWLSNDTVVYRVKTQGETADYVTGLEANTAKKITDVTDTPGRSLWYFY
jgi:hypothetical protein